MLQRLTAQFNQYPKQFWLMFLGMLLSTIGNSMIWPFLMIYVTETLEAPMTVGASLYTINAAMSIGASFVGGPLLDRAGRKWIMVFSLVANGLANVFMGHASAYLHFAILMALTGAVNPLYRAGADAMMADLVPSKQRADAYSLMRLSNNLGISLGMLIGGSVAATSYTLAFYCAAAGMTLYGLLMAFFGSETLPTHPPESAGQPVGRERFGGYPAILRDGEFMGFVLTFTLAQICAILMWTMMGAYAKSHYGVLESTYKWIPATNALMVVTLQQLVTRHVKNRPPLMVLAAGSAIYALSVGGVALATNFWGFWICMVVMTLGELILVPTSSTYAANLAPADKRGRYLSIYGLSWPVGSGIGPVFGGVMNDNFGPQAIWYGGLGGGLVSVLVFVLIGRRALPMERVAEPPAAD